MDPKLGIFLVVYAGMILGGIPGLALDRTGVALLGALTLIAFGQVAMAEAWDAVDLPTMALLFGLMILSAQLRLGGFYSALTRRVGQSALGPQAFLGGVIFLSAALAALLTNDVICLAITPILIEVCERRGLNPVPYLLALACATNIGSAASLIGNPQNILIGQTLGLSFGAYTVQALPPVLASLFAVWAIIRRAYRHNWTHARDIVEVAAPPFDIWHTAKGWATLVAVIAFFLFTSAPREIIVLGAAAIILCSRRMHSQDALALVDWPLLVLFFGLFVVHRAFDETGVTENVVHFLDNRGVDLHQPHWLFVASVVLSNIVSNVPATMLLLPVADHPNAGLVLALGSTFAGNLFIVGSIANIIVVEQAAKLGIRIGWREHARVGAPVALLSLSLAALWLVVI